MVRVLCTLASLFHTSLHTHDYHALHGVPTTRRSKSSKSKSLVCQSQYINTRLTLNSKLNLVPMLERLTHHPITCIVNLPCNTPPSRNQQFPPFCGLNELQMRYTFSIWISPECILLSICTSEHPTKGSFIMTLLKGFLPVTCYL